MKNRMYAIRDNVANFFTAPFVSPNDAHATRILALEMYKEDSTIRHYPEQFDLYRLGEYDDQSGIILTEPLPELLCNAASLQKRNENHG